MFYPRAKAIVINQDKCVGCRKCMEMCCSDVFRFDEEKKMPVPQYVDDCEACLVCEVHCPTDALRVEPAFPIHVPDPFQ